MSANSDPIFGNPDRMQDLINRNAPVRLATTLLTHAQILTLPSTPVIVSPTPLANEYIFPLSCAFSADFTGGYYYSYNDTDYQYAALMVRSGGTFSWFALGIQGFSNRFFSTAGQVLACGLGSPMDDADPVAMLGQPLKLSIDRQVPNVGVNLVTGNVNNWLRVTLTYTVRSF